MIVYAPDRLKTKRFKEITRADKFINDSLDMFGMLRLME
jgi:hypothetical protein